MKIIGVREPTGAAEYVAALSGDLVCVLATKDDFWTDPGRLVDPLMTDGPWRSRAAYTEIPVVPRSARVLCVGLNYRAHAAEGGFTVPDWPTLFGRFTASLSVGGVSAPVPSNEPGLDWEGEIAAYVGATLVDVDADEARRSVLGYSTFLDLTARIAQKRTSQWTLGKNGDRSGPLGPLVTSDEVGDLRDGLRLRTRVNGVTVQDANTTDMIFEAGELLSLISHTLTLQPGDVIATGTPEGVGYVRTPPWVLRDGDVVEVEVDKLGVLRTPIGGSRP